MKIPRLLNIPVTKEDGLLTDTWLNLLSQTLEQLGTHLSDEGYRLPQQTTSNVTILNTALSKGAILYNSDTNQPMINIYSPTSQTYTFKSLAVASEVDEDFNDQILSANNQTLFSTNQIDIQSTIATDKIKLQFSDTTWWYLPKDSGNDIVLAQYIISSQNAVTVDLSNYPFIDINLSNDENLWDRVVATSTLIPHNTNDNVNIGSGSYSGYDGNFSNGVNVGSATGATIGNVLASDGAKGFFGVNANNGITFSSSNTFAIALNGTFKYSGSVNAFSPYLASTTVDLGTNTVRWNSLYLKSNALIGSSASSSDFSAATISSYADTGYSDATSTCGVVGETSATIFGIKKGIGVLGISLTNSGGHGYGIYGISNVSNSGDAGSAYGGYFTSTATHAGGTNYGIYAKAVGGATNWAGYFDGNIGTTGQIVSSLATGTSPLSVTSTTENINLNSQLWHGQQFDSQANEFNTGFQSWTSGTDASSYIVDGTGFTVVRSGTGYIKGVLVSWTAGQKTAALSANNTSFIYMNSAGLIGVTTTESDALFQENIVLFQCFFDGTNYLVNKENHPYYFQTMSSRYLHWNVGIVIRGIGAIITRVATGSGGSADDRRIKIVGADSLDDHGLTTTIAEVNPAVFNIYYKNGSSNWIRYSLNSEFPMYYNNAGTPTVLTSGKFGIFTLYASKDDIQSATPKYIAVMDSAEYLTLVAAQNALTNNTNSRISSPLALLEAAQLGYIIVRNSGGGYIDTVVVSKSTFNSKLVGGGASTQYHDLLLGLELATTGITWGHINDSAQTVYGVKTFNDIVCAGTTAVTTDFPYAATISSVGNSTYTDTSSKIGIVGEALAVNATNDAIGALGIAKTAGNKSAYGVYGIVGTSATGDTGDAIGGYFESSLGLHAGGTNYGIYAKAVGGATNWAGYFDGDVNVVNDINISGDANIDGTLTYNSLPAVRTVYHDISFSTTVSSTTSRIPFDGTKPQISEGAEFMSVSYTPKSTNSVIIARAKGTFINNAADWVVVALFESTTGNDALDAQVGYYLTQYARAKADLIAKITNSSLSTRTFSIRVGAWASGTVYSVTDASPNYTLGGCISLSIEIEEILL